MSYSREFFDHYRARSRSSAQAVLPIVLERLEPARVIDVGCGVGTWLAVARSLGVEQTCGVDGEHVDRAALEIDPADFLARDLERRLALTGAWDLALSLEVAEHLSPGRAESFVGELCALAPAVLFSAAIPHQGGEGHRHERWQSHWAALFAAHGYLPLDLVRPEVWDDPRVEPWYAQNTLLYAGPPLHTRLGLPAGAPGPLDLVHPRLYETQHERPEVAATARRLGLALRGAARRRLR